MRLRSSQFVFLLLLACSVQVGEELAWQVIAGTRYGRTASVAQAYVPARAPHAASQLERHFSVQVSTLRLGPASRAAQRVAWTPRYPARASSAISSFTSLLRA